MSNVENELLKEIRDLLVEQNWLIARIEDENKKLRETNARAQIESERYLQKNTKLRAAEVRNNLVFLGFTIVLIIMLFVAPRFS